MTVRRDYFVGFVPSTVRGRPVKFSVKYTELGPDSGDPTNDWAHFYFFVPNAVSNGLEPGYEVRVTSDAAMQFFRDDSSRTIFVVRYALDSIRRDPSTPQIDIISKDYTRYSSSRKSEGTELRNQILLFYYDWYKVLPQENIGVPDLLLNFHAEEEQLSQWTKSLVEKKLLMGTESRTYGKELGFGYSTNAYKINPENEEEVKLVLGKLPHVQDGQIRRAFLSYKTSDKKLAGEIASLLRSNYGVDVFLAHEQLKVSAQWREEILRNIDECDVLIALVTSKFRSSKWTDQEVGIAIGKKKRVVPLMGVKSLHGFLETSQGLHIGDDPDQVVKRIALDLGMTAVQSDD